MFKNNDLGIAQKLPSIRGSIVPLQATFIRDCTVAQVLSIRRTESCDLQNML